MMSTMLDEVARAATLRENLDTYTSSRALLTLADKVEAYFRARDLYLAARGNLIGDMRVLGAALLAAEDDLRAAVSRR